MRAARAVWLRRRRDRSVCVRGSTFPRIKEGGDLEGFRRRNLLVPITPAVHTTHSSSVGNSSESSARCVSASFASTHGGLVGKSRPEQSLLDPGVHACELVEGGDERAVEVVVGKSRQVHREVLVAMVVVIVEVVVRASHRGVRESSVVVHNGVKNLRVVLRINELAVNPVPDVHVEGGTGLNPRGWHQPNRRVTVRRARSQWNCVVNLCDDSTGGESHGWEGMLLVAARSVVPGGWPLRPALTADVPLLAARVATVVSVVLVVVGFTASFLWWAAPPLVGGGGSGGGVRGGEGDGELLAQFLGDDARHGVVVASGRIGGEGNRLVLRTGGGRAVDVYSLLVDLLRQFLHGDLIVLEV